MNLALRRKHPRRPRSASVISPDAAPVLDVAALLVAEAEVSRLTERVTVTESVAAANLASFRAERAAFANHRRRVAEDEAASRDLADERLLGRVLDVTDDFARATATRPAGLVESAWCGGLDAIGRKLAGILAMAEVDPIDATPGLAFDPAEHEAIALVSGTDRAEGQIFEEIRPGYRRRGRVIRTAQVAVAGAAGVPARI